MNNTQKQANCLRIAMQATGVPAFQDAAFGLYDRRRLESMVQDAKRLHTIAEHECNGYSYKGMKTRQRNLERSIEETAKSFGLTVDFQGDPRGYVVKLHAPVRNVYNTWGGTESGYGIG